MGFDHLPPQRGVGKLGFTGGEITLIVLFLGGGGEKCFFFLWAHPPGKRAPGYLPGGVGSHALRPPMESPLPGRSLTGKGGDRGGGPRAGGGRPTRPAKSPPLPRD